MWFNLLVQSASRTYVFCLIRLNWSSLNAFGFCWIGFCWYGPMASWFCLTWYDFIVLICSLHFLDSSSQWVLFILDWVVGTMVQIHLVCTFYIPISFNWKKMCNRFFTFEQLACLLQSHTSVSWQAVFCDCTVIQWNALHFSCFKKYESEDDILVSSIGFCGSTVVRACVGWVTERSCFCSSRGVDYRKADILQIGFICCWLELINYYFPLCPLHSAWIMCSNKQVTILQWAY